DPVGELAELAQVVVRHRLDRAEPHRHAVHHDGDGGPHLLEHRPRPAARLEEVLRDDLEPVHPGDAVLEQVSEVGQPQADAVAERCAVPRGHEREPTTGTRKAARPAEGAPEAARPAPRRTTRQAAPPAPRRTTRQAARPAPRRTTRQAAPPAPRRGTGQAARPARRRTRRQAAPPAPRRTTRQAARPAPRRTTRQAAPPAPRRTTRQAARPAPRSARPARAAARRLA